MATKVPSITVAPPGPKARAVLVRDERWIATTTKTSPLVVKRAEGSVIEDVDGNTYIDFTCGVSVLNVGHGHPLVTSAIKEQVDAFTHYAGTDFYYDIQTRLAPPGGGRRRCSSRTAGRRRTRPP